MPGRTPVDRELRDIRLAIGIIVAQLEHNHRLLHTIAAKIDVPDLTELHAETASLKARADTLAAALAAQNK